METQSITHLHWQHCISCGHPYLSHHHNPSCRECACVQDPKCAVCGALTSSHEVDEV